MKNKSGLIIAAAFIGPGTVTTASLAGAQLGMHLGWALLFSIFTTLVLHDMVIRLSATTHLSLSKNILSVFTNKYIKRSIAILIFLAIGIGNTAYQSGNLTGAAIGMISATNINTNYWPVAIGLIAAIMLLCGSYKWIERILISLVGIMSGVFIITLVAVQPDWLQLFKQIFTPTIEFTHFNLALGLIGTTVVPYNLFLHASLIAQSKPNVALATTLKDIRFDSAIAIVIGGVVSMVIMATASVAFFNTSTTLDVANIGAQLKPVLGAYAGLFFGIGLFAAGITSAVTAPLAAGYAITSVMGWSTNVKGKAFREIALGILVIGVFFATVAIKPLTLIVIAQVTNALLLPLVIWILLLVMKRHPRLNSYKNTPAFNAAGVIVLFVLLLLSGYKLIGLFS